MVKIHVHATQNMKKFHVPRVLFKVLIKVAIHDRDIKSATFFDFKMIEKCISKEKMMGNGTYDCITDVTGSEKQLRDPYLPCIYAYLSHHDPYLICQNLPIYIVMILIYFVLRCDDPYLSLHVPCLCFDNPRLYRHDPHLSCYDHSDVFYAMMQTFIQAFK